MPEPGPTDPAPEAPPEPAGLRRLRRLVTLLTLTMIIGITVIAASLAVRVWRPGPPVLPEGFALPENRPVSAVTVTRHAVVVLTGDGAVLVFDRVTGRLLQEVPLPAAPDP